MAGETIRPQQADENALRFALDEGMIDSGGQGQSQSALDVDKSVRIAGKILRTMGVKTLGKALGVFGRVLDADAGPGEIAGAVIGGIGGALLGSRAGARGVAIGGYIGAQGGAWVGRRWDDPNYGEPQ